jgi:carbonic anhydrase
VPPYEPESPGFHGTSAAIEFGVRVLKVSRLVVLGHAQCGGVKAMVFGAPPKARDFIAAWVDIGKPALDGVDDGASRLSEVELGVVRVSMANLMGFPWVAEAVAAGRLHVEGFCFDIHTGMLSRVLPDGAEVVD